MLDLWTTKQSDAGSARRTLEERIAALQHQEAQLVDAYCYRCLIADDVYRRESDRLKDEIAVARAALYDAEADELDVEGVLNFAEYVILEPRRLWTESTVDQRQRLQQFLFPSGVTYSREHGFGTAEHCVFFRWLAATTPEKEQMASPAGFEPASPT